MNMKPRALDTTTRLVHIVIKAPHPKVEKDHGQLLCDRIFLWDSAPNWYCEKFLARGHVIASRRSNEAMPTCFDCIARDIDDGTTGS